jgi:hypothetical protein
MSRAILFLAVAALAASGCGASATAPSDAPLRVTVSVNPTFVADPSSASFSLAAENISQGVVDLTFPSSCQLLPYFVERTTRQVVTPAGGGFACLTVITQASLVSGEKLARSVLVKSGTTPDGQNIVLPPGEYLIYGRLEDQRYRLKSEELAFSLR